MSIFGIRTQTKKSYETSNIVLLKPLGSLNGNKQNTIKLTKPSTNQQHKIPQQLGKILSRMQQSTDQLDTTFPDKENQTPSFIQSPTFSKQSDTSEVKFARYTFATSQQSMDTTPSESMITQYKQIQQELDCKLDHEMFEIWDKLK